MVLKPNREEYSKSVVSRELLSARKTLRNRERQWERITVSKRERENYRVQERLQEIKREWNERVRKKNICQGRKKERDRYCSKEKL